MASKDCIEKRILNDVLTISCYVVVDSMLVLGCSREML